MRRVSFAATAAAVALATGAPFADAQQDDVLPTEQLIDYWALDQGREVVREDADTAGGELPWLDVDDPPLDNNIFSTGETTGLTDIPAETDILAFSGESWNPPPDFYRASPGGVLCDDLANPLSPDFATACGTDGVDGPAFADGATIFSFELGAPVGGFRRAGQTCEWVIWLNIPESGETWENRPAFPSDPAGGTNLAIGVRRSDEGTMPFALDLVDGGFSPAATAAVAVFGGNRLDIHVPNDEFSGATQANGYAFCTSGAYSAADSTSDQTGLIDIDPDAMTFFSIVDAPDPPAPLVFGKQFTDDPVIAGDTVTLEFTIKNPNETREAANITFTDDFAVGLEGLGALGLPISDVCGAGSGLTGTTSLQLTGASLGPGESCTFSVTLEVPLISTDGTFTNTTSSLTATVGGVAVTSDPASGTLTVAPDDEGAVVAPAGEQKDGTTPGSESPDGGFPWGPAVVTTLLIALVIAALKKLRDRRNKQVLSGFGLDLTASQDLEESGIDTLADGTVLEWYTRTSEGSSAIAGTEGSAGNNFGRRTYTYPDQTIRVETSSAHHRRIEITHPDKTKDVYEVRGSWEGRQYATETDPGDSSVPPVKNYRERFTDSHQRIDANGKVVQSTDWDGTPPPHPWEISGLD